VITLDVEARNQTQQLAIAAKGFRAALRETPFSLKVRRSAKDARVKPAPVDRPGLVLRDRRNRHIP
jgi:hypothetical protein